jgi:flagellar motor switch protein FliG
MSPRPFTFLNTLDAESIRSLLANERPQVAAAVISHLPKDLALSVLRRFSATFQESILRRIVVLEPIPSAILGDLAHALDELQSASRV